jgi:hypothetical protein
MNTALQSIRSTIIHIRSKDASDLTNGIYNTNFRVNIINPIICSLDEEVHISVMSCEIPYSFYNVSSELANNTIHYDTSNTLTFENQDYSIDDVINYFNQDTTGFSALFTTTYNAQKNKITFTNKTNANHTINFSKSLLSKVIGWNDSSLDEVVAASASITSPGVCNLATVHSIMVKCSAGQGNVISTRAGNSETLQKISVDVNSNGIIYLNQQDFRQVSVSQSPGIDTMEFRFTDQNDNLIQLNQCNFEFSMLFDVFPKYAAPRRSITQPPARIQVPGQQMNVIRRAPVNEANDTHPLENTTEAEHKSNRLVLDHLVESIAEMS